MTLRLTDDEQAAFRERAEAEGISMQDAARRAVREFVTRGNTSTVSAPLPRSSSTNTPTPSIASAGERRRVPRPRRRPRSRCTTPRRPTPIRDLGLLGSAVARPQTTDSATTLTPTCDQGGRPTAVDREQPRARRRQQAARMARHRRVPRTQRHQASPASNNDVYDLVIESPPTPTSTTSPCDSEP